MEVQWDQVDLNVEVERLRAEWTAGCSQDLRLILNSLHELEDRFATQQASINARFKAINDRIDKMQRGY